MAMNKFSLKAPPDLEIGGGRVVDIEMEFMSFEERDKEKEILRQRDHDDMVSGRCSPQEVNDRNAIDWGTIKSQFQVPELSGLGLRSVCSDGPAAETSGDLYTSHRLFRPQP